ncbi:MAG: site-specific integrase [Gallionella sp.]|nr:site-specific integrase [Gallionella sp.]
MARLESINYDPHHAIVEERKVYWVPEFGVQAICGLPQIFWECGTPWFEANHWALDKIKSMDIKLNTVQNLMGHLHEYSIWLEEEKMDWRHFPTRKSDRVLVRYRGALIKARDCGDIRPSTTTARMRAVIQFYRHCHIHSFVSRNTPKWKDKLVVVKYFDHAGFERVINRLSTDMAIPNRARPGIMLEDGLLPISAENQSQLLRFVSEKIDSSAISTLKNCSEELRLLLMAGFFTGGRIGTLTAIRVDSIENATPAPEDSGLWILPVGPGTGIPTKFDVSGNLYIPDQLMKLLNKYAYSPRRLNRLEKASEEHRHLLFLNRFGAPYKPSAVTRGMVDLRRCATHAGLKFMKDFYFHQTRATFGTWLPGVKPRGHHHLSRWIH